MSHASLLVILSPQTSLSKLDDILEQVMRPFDENRDTFRREVMTQDEVHRMREFYENADDATAEDRIRYTKLNPDWNKNLIEDGRVDQWDGTGDPEPTDRINGKSIEVDKFYNPRSKWDWWEIGGRWSGYFPIKQGADPSTCDDRYVNSQGKADVIRYDSIDWNQLTEEHPHNMSTFAILDARLNDDLEPEWIENGRLGWFGMTIGALSSEEEWEDRWAEIVHSVDGDCLLVIVDYHI